MFNINYSIALESLNASTSIVGILLVCFMFFYVVDSHKDPEGRSIWKCWLCGQLDVNLQLAVALFFLFVGSAIVRGWAWVFRHTINGGGTWTASSGSSWLIFGGVITLAAMVCLIRIVTIARFGKWPWRFATAVAAASAFGTFYLPF